MRSARQLRRGTHDFVHTSRDRRGSQSTQPHQHAAKRDIQINKNNIDNEGYQAIAKQRKEIGDDWNAWLFPSCLRLRLRDQSIKPPSQPTKIKPSQRRSNDEARRPVFVVQQKGGSRSEASDEQRQPRDKRFRKLFLPLGLGWFCGLIDRLHGWRLFDATEDFANPTDETQRTKNQRQNWLRVQPAIQVKTHQHS